MVPEVAASVTSQTGPFEEDGSIAEKKGNKVKAFGKL